MDEPSIWERLTTPPLTEDVFSPPALAFLVFFAIGFIASAVLSGGGGLRGVAHPATRRLARRAGAVGTWLFGAGLFFFGVRALGINPFGFGAPIWLWLCLLLILGALLWFVVYWQRVHPRRLEAFEQQRMKQQYLRPPGKAGQSRAAPARRAPTGRR